MKRFVLWLPLSVFIVASSFFALRILMPSNNDLPSHWVGHPMPDFALQAIAKGKPGLSHADLKGGKPRLVNLFGSWCVPCAAEAPVLKQLAAQGIEIDGIALRDTPEAVDGFLQHYGDPFTRIGSDPVSSVSIALGSTGVPETYVVDSKGIIRVQHIGEIRAEDVPALLQAMGDAQ